MQAVLEKAVVLGMATGQRTASPVLGELVTRYASLLAAEGRMGTALQYLDMVPGEACMSTAVLKHRIYSSRAKDIPATSAIPPFPYEGYDLKGQASASDATYGAQYAQQQQYQYQTYQQQQRIAAYQQPAYNQQPQQPTYQQAYGYSQQQQPAPVQQFTPSPARNFTPANQGVGSQSVVAPNPNASTGFSAAAPAPLAVPAPTVFKPQKPSSPTHPAHAAPQPNVFTPQPHTAPAQQPAIPQPSPFVPQVTHNFLHTSVGVGLAH